MSAKFPIRYAHIYFVFADIESWKSYQSAIDFVNLEKIVWNR